jgi:hypothetical protein
VGLAALLLVGGCKCPSTKERAEEQRAADLAKLPRGGGSLQDQLAAEAAGRPKDTATLEALTTALSKEGITFNAPRQVYGQKLLAAYCAAADSTNGLIVTVCEYPDAEQAARGLTETNLLGSKISGYQSKVSKKSVLQVVARSDTPQEHVAKVLGIFEAL